jgi:hypothetical protein
MATWIDTFSKAKKTQKNIILFFYWFKHYSLLTEYQYRKRLLANTQDNNEDDIADDPNIETAISIKNSLHILWEWPNLEYDIGINW